MESHEDITFEDYQEFVEGSASSKSTRNLESRLGTCFGLCTESGEACDLIKKYLYQEADFDQEDFIEELGDIFWYLGFACNTMGISIQEVMNRNVAKLKSRYKTGKFTREEFLKKEFAKVVEKTKLVDKVKSFFRRRSS